MTHTWNRARSWFREANADTDPFGRFTKLWFAFNSMYNEFYERDERRAIGDFVFSPSYHIDAAVIQQIMQAESSRFFAERTIRDVRGGNDTTEDRMKLTNQWSSPNKKLKALLMILYQARCNLIHGHKSPEGLTDQTVSGHAADALYRVLEAYFAIPAASG